MSARRDTNVPSPSFFERGNVKNVLEHCYVSTLLCISISFFVVFLLLQFQFLTIVLLTTVSSNRRAGYTPIVSGWRSKRQFRTTYLTAMSVCSGKRQLCTCKSDAITETNKSGVTKRNTRWTVVHLLPFFKVYFLFMFEATVRRRCLSSSCVYVLFCFFSFLCVLDVRTIAYFALPCLA